MQAVFSQDFERLTLTDLLPGGKARDHLKAAEAGVADGDVTAALVGAALGFEWALRDAEQSGPKLGWITDQRRWARRLRLPHTGFRTARQQDPEVADALEQLSERSERTETAVYLLARGVNYDEYLMFDELTPLVSFVVGQDDPIVNVSAAVQPSVDEAKMVCRVRYPHSGRAVRTDKRVPDFPTLEQGV